MQRFKKESGRPITKTSLGQSEANFRGLLGNSPLPMWVYSIASLKFLEVNDAAIAHYGYSRDEFLGMTLLDIRPPDDAERLLATLPLVSSGAYERTGWCHRAKNGRIMDVEVYSHDILVGDQPARVTVVVDIVKRKEAERQKQRLFETSQDVILITNSYGVFTQVSPSSAATLGYQPDEMIGRGGHEFIFPEDLEATQSEVREARRGRAIRNFRCRYVHKDGRVVPLVWMGVWAEADKRHYFVGRDMTEYEHTEAQLRQAQKMEAVGQLTGGVAHDFNNILMIIMANADALEEEGGLAPPLLERIKGISDATQRAADLTRQLLSFSRKQVLRPQRTNVNDLVAATSKLLQRTLGERIKIDTLLAKDIWNVEIDRAQLESALVNLSINARDAMPDGGRLIIETKNVELDGDYAAVNAGVIAGDYLMLAVTDTGQGIAPEVLLKVFEPFFTTKAVGKGTGLGLSMVYGFVKQSKGHIKIYSEVGRGTSIKLYLPRTGGKSKEAAAEQRLPTPRGNERILIVEDDAQVRAGVVYQLQSLGYAVAEASDGATGLATFEAELPHDLLLTDIVLPGAISGKALVDEVTRRWPQTKIIFMSGYTENAIVLQGQLGPDVLLLSKPFRKNDLAQILRQALDGTPASLQTI